MTIVEMNRLDVRTIDPFEFSCQQVYVSSLKF